MKWRPIKTAPKDKPILLLMEGYAIEGAWDDDEWFDRWEPVSLDCHGCGCCGATPAEPTHWLPLPTL
jgi:hypothetical protein